MEFYPSELTSPPVPLVALIGKPDLHISLGEYLRSQNVPRVHSIGIPDAHSAAGTLGSKKTLPSSTTAGILKAGWLRKHRTSRPAVAALLVDREAVVGDPTSWAWLVSQLDAVRAAARARGARMVVLIVQKPDLPAAEVPEDRVAMICRQAGVERRCVISYTPSQGLPALQLVGKVLHNQAVEFYMADAQRRLAAHAQRNVPSTDLNLRMAFKLGALAEFRGDWAAAVRMYREAYTYVPQVLAGCAAQPQRFVEVRTVAEHLHVKVASLLLLALRQPSEALAQFEAHLRLLRRVPFEAPPGLQASHNAWLCRQYTVMAELLLSASADPATLKREHQPGHLYLAAARAAIERRRLAAFIAGMRGGTMPQLAGKVEPGPFVGQLVLLPWDPAAAAVAAGGAAVAAALAGLPSSGAAAAAGVTRRLSEAQFEAHLEAMEAGVQQSRAAIDLLRTAQEALQSSGRRTGKTLRHAQQLLGRELLEAGEVGAAAKLLAEVAASYRHERWEGPLAATLALLRECRQQEADVAAHTQLSLELASLQCSALDDEQRGAMAAAAAAVLAPREDGTSGEPGSPGQQQQQQQQQVDGMHYTVSANDEGWLTVLPLCAGFFDCSPGASLHAAAAAADAASGDIDSRGCGSVRFAAAVWNNAPADLPLASAQLHLRDDSGTFTAPLQLEQCSGSSSRGWMLASGTWLRVTTSVPARCSGQLQATALVLRFGTAATASSITFQLSCLFPIAPPQLSGSRAADGLAGTVGWLRRGWDSSMPPFSTAAGFLPCHCAIEVPPQHAPPLLLLQAPEALLQGEQAAVAVTLAAADAGALHGAVLRARAVHVESKRALRLEVVDGGAHIQSAADAAAAPPHDPGSAAPPADLALPLGEVAAGERRQLALLLDARYRGTVRLSVEVKYTATAHGAGGAQEAGRCAAVLPLQVQQPWKLELQLLGPPATHTLLAAPPPVAAGSSPRSSDASTEELLSEQQRRLQHLSVQEPLPTPSTAAETAAGQAAGGAADLATSLLRGLPPRLVLPGGQRCTALVQVQSQAVCELDVLAVQLEGADGVQVAPADAAPQADHGDSAPADTLCRSDKYVAAFSVSGGGSAATEVPSLGLLRIRWRRHEPSPPLAAVAARGPAALDTAAAKAVTAELERSCGDLQAVAADPTPPCEVLVPLPPVDFRQCLLTAALTFPPAAVAGRPSDLTLSLRNGGAASQEVAVAVGDPHGFLLAGPKATRVQVLPHSSASVSWQAVPYHTGLLRLPEITATALQLGQAVEVSRGCSAFVERPPEQLLQEEPGGPGAGAAQLAESPRMLEMEPGLI